MKDNKISFWEAAASLLFPFLGAPIVAINNRDNKEKLKETALFASLGLITIALYTYSSSKE